MEHHTIDNSEPKEEQCIRGLYKKNEPVVFELLQLIKDELVVGATYWCWGSCLLVLSGHDQRLLPG